MVKSTRQHLQKTDRQCLFRHEVNETYYGITKIHGKRKEHSLKTTDRKLAERKLKDWLEDLSKTEANAERTTLSNLLKKYEASNQGKAAKTRSTRRSIAKVFSETWRFGLTIRVSAIKPSDLNEWLALHESRLKHSTYNEYTRFLRHLFEIALKDKIIAQSPFSDVKTKWKRPQKPIRLTPTQEQFEAIVANMRAQESHAEAETSADFVEFLGSAGLGQKEASTLRWPDIDFTKNRITIRRGKTDALFFVPIFPHLAPLLKRMKSKHNKSGRNVDLVFPIKDSKKALLAACTRLDLPHFSQRAIRRVLIQRLWKAGVDKKLIAKWQGHSDGGKLIMDTYTEAFGSDDDKYEEQELAKIA